MSAGARDVRWARCREKVRLGRVQSYSIRSGNSPPFSSLTCSLSAKPQV